MSEGNVRRLPMPTAMNVMVVIDDGEGEGEGRDLRFGGVEVPRKSQVFGSPVLLVCTDSVVGAQRFSCIFDFGGRDP